jgi:hypothetical protein
MPDLCPHCRADLTGKPIPEQWRDHYGDATHYSNRIGVQITGVYDGILHWMCPFCDGKWHRWPEGHWLRKAAEKYIGGGVRDCANAA